jgi:transaldolase
LKKLSLIGKDLDEYSRETVQMFYEDACKSGFTLSGSKTERPIPAGAAQGVA